MFAKELPAEEASVSTDRIMSFLYKTIRNVSLYVMVVLENRLENHCPTMHDKRMGNKTFEIDHICLYIY